MPTGTDVASNVSAERQAPSERGGTRLVQLTTDHLLASSNGTYDRASIRSEFPASLSAMLQSAPAGYLLPAAISALLFRHAKQDTIPLDVFQPGAVPGLPPFLALNTHVDDGEPFAALASRIGVELRRLTESRAVQGAAADSANVAISWVGIPPGAYDMVFCFSVVHGSAGLDVVYNASLFNADSMARYAESLFTMLTDALDRPDATVGDLLVVSAGDLHLLTNGWESGRPNYPDEPVFKIFERLVAAQPEAVAVRGCGERLTYADLDDRSNRLARVLVDAGVRPGANVAVCVLPSVDIAVAILGIFKAGAVYVPVDPTHPRALIDFILEEAKPALVLTQSRLLSVANAFSFPLFCLDLDLEKAELPESVPAVELIAGSPCYLIYTSGTTGKPKGVLATHANLAHYIHAAQQMYRFNKGDVFCSLARYTFSISLFEILSPLCCGGSLIVVDRDVLLTPDRLLQQLTEVTVLHAGPSLLGGVFRYLRTNPAAQNIFPLMRHASSGGDVVPPSVLEDMKRVFAEAEIYVIYGCTEISCMGTTFPVSRDEVVTRSYIGKPFPDVAVRVLDSNRQLAPIGAPGEICIAGKGVVPGYYNRDDLTAEKFVAIDGRRFYLTGDMGRFSRDGNLEMLGRSDFQIKLRGIRIELVAIENTIRDLGLATQCALTVRTLGEQDDRLVAFVVSPRESGIAAFRDALAKVLPEYMLPHHLVVLDAMPLTANGKLDRKALKSIPFEVRSKAELRAPPRNAIEQLIANIFARVLGLDEVNVDENFFDLGGHSILAVLVTQELENDGISLSPDALFLYSTVEAIAEHVQDPAKNGPRPILLTSRSDKPQLFMIAGVHLYRDLAKQLEGEFSVYGVYASSELTLFESKSAPPSVAVLAAEYIDIMRREQPSGPYRLIGMSFGGIIAYEVVQQLRDAGEEVEFLGLLDAILPATGARSLIKKLKGIAKLPGRLLRPDILARIYASRARLANRSITRFGGQGREGALEDLRVDAYHHASEAYVKQVRPYDGKVLLFVAGKRLAREAGSRSCGWDVYASNLEVHTLDSEHLELLEQPIVRIVARILQRQASMDPGQQEQPPV